MVGAGVGMGAETPMSIAMASVGTLVVKAKIEGALLARDPATLRQTMWW